MEQRCCTFVWKWKWKKYYNVTIHCVRLPLSPRGSLCVVFKGRLSLGLLVFFSVFGLIFESKRKWLWSFVWKLSESLKA